VTRPGGGTLLEYVTLHVPLVPGMPAPSIAGDIRIAEQVVEEGVIAVADESALRPGMALRAVAVPLASGDSYGCAFVPARRPRMSTNTNIDGNDGGDGVYVVGIGLHPTSSRATRPTPTSASRRCAVRWPTRGWTGSRCKARMWAPPPSAWPRAA
jgi:hypothetical protein